MKKPIIIYFFFILTVSCKEKVCIQKEDNNKHSNSRETINKSVISKPTINKAGFVNNLFVGCGYNYKSGIGKIELFKPNLREVKQINDILEFTGLPLNFEIYQANIENAIATIINNKRYIIYDKKLFNYVDYKSSNYWSSMSILAHEIGHHLAGHTMNIDKRNSYNNQLAELEADQYSGFILYKMGASLEQAQYAMNEFGSENESDSHPSKYKRLKSIEKGWINANQSRGKSAVPPPLNDDIQFIDEEFNLEQITDIYTFNENHSNYDINDYGIFEGIITDVEKENNSFYKINFLITKKPMHPMYNIKADNIMIDALFDGSASMFQMRILQDVFKAGRKAKFAFVYEGATGSYASLTYLKIIKR